MKIPLRHSVPALIFIAGFGVLLSTYVIERDALRRDARNLADQQLRSAASYVAGELEASFRAGNLSAGRSTIERAAVDRKIKLVFLVNPDGTVQFANDVTLNGQHNSAVHRDVLLRQLLLEVPDNLEARILQSPDVGIAVGRFPIHMRGVEQDFLPQEFGWLYILYDMSFHVERQQHELLVRMVPRSAALALLTLIFWILFRRFLLQRIDRLIASVRAVAKGDFSNDPVFTGTDELSELGNEIAGMMRNLRSHMDEIAYLVDHDPLTRLLNRSGFETEVERALRYLKFGGKANAVCLLDIDSLRVVNDTQGHTVGDALLSAFGDMLANQLDNVVAVARVGGDEFAVLLEVAPDSNLDTVAQDMQSTIRRFRFESNAELFGVQVTIGMVLLHETIANAAEALSLADTACYVAKERGHSPYAIWQPETEEWARQHGQMRWVTRIQKALDEDRFCLYAQQIKPLASRKNGGGIHVEILVRMINESGEMVPPGDFLGAAERYNLIGRIDRWVIRETFRWLRANAAVLRRIKMCAINLSGVSFGDASLFEFIRSEFAASESVRPQQLCFEITETAAITHLEHARTFIGKLRSMGCSVALDDFGSGVSSFGYLKNLPVDIIKIDGMFVRDMLKNSADRAIVNSINSIVHEMGKKTIAEFAETREIINVLRDIGVDFAQGYGVARPVPLNDIK